MLTAGPRQLFLHGPVKGYLDDAAGECELLDKQSPLCRGGRFVAALCRDSLLPT